MRPGPRARPATPPRPGRRARPRQESVKVLLGGVPIRSNPTYKGGTDHVSEYDSRAPTRDQPREACRDGLTRSD